MKRISIILLTSILLVSCKKQKEINIEYLSELGDENSIEMIIKGFDTPKVRHCKSVIKPIWVPKEAIEKMGKQVISLIKDVTELDSDVTDLDEDEK